LLFFFLSTSTSTIKLSSSPSAPLGGEFIHIHTFIYIYTHIYIYIYIIKTGGRTHYEIKRILLSHSRSKCSHHAARACGSFVSACASPILLVARIRLAFWLNFGTPRFSLCDLTLTNELNPSIAEYPPDTPLSFLTQPRWSFFVFGYPVGRGGNPSLYCLFWHILSAPVPPRGTFSGKELGGGGGGKQQHTGWSRTCKRQIDKCGKGRQVQSAGKKGRL
jgi:hypothetical protein